ncbi:DUF4167 domain-containing protein [Roseibium limicola]|nr:DUF4167 domain-containing protein [Roseibium limicola]
MRPGNQSNKRMRGRGRKGPNPLTRSYESNGPDVKIRGTALHIAEKYQQLARDAHVSGDRVMSENYFQHAEHYLRIVASAQAQNPIASQQRGDDDMDDQEDEAQDASPRAERSERSERSERVDRSDRADRPDRAERADRPDRAERAERPDRADRPDRSERVARPDRAERAERAERRERSNKERESRGPSVDPDSPQPFIESMPIIDESGQLNGRASGPDDVQNDDDAKPRRRVRGTRGRGVKREDDAPEAGAPVVAAAEADTATGEEAAPVKPKRRAPRRKVVEQPAEPETVDAGE